MIIHSHKKPSRTEKFIAYFGNGQTFDRQKVRNSLGINGPSVTEILSSLKDNIVIDGENLRWTNNKEEARQSRVKKEINLDEMRKQYLAGVKTIKDIAITFRTTGQKVLEYCSDLKHLRKPVKNQFNTPEHLRRSQNQTRRS